MLMATHSGLRGRPGAELSREVVERTVAGLVALIRSRELSDVVGIARDERPSSASLASDVARVARAGGVDVIDFGALSAPGAKLAARSRGLGGAVIVTGSHLEPDLNGLKLVAGPSYGPVDIRELPPPGKRVARRTGRLHRDESAVEEHVAAIRDSVDSEIVRRAGLSVDCEGGAGPAPHLLLQELGCRSDPRHADLGLRLDADGDRLQLADERGNALDTEFILPLVMLAREAWTIVKGADTSRMVDALAANRGGGVRVVPAGEIHLFEELSEHGGDLAGEGNGGIVVPEVGIARDALAAAAAILSLLARTDAPLSGLTSELPAYTRRRSTVPRGSITDGPAALEALARRMGADFTNPEIGVCVESGDGSWGLVRMSATEPVIRITVEASTEAEAESLHGELRAALLEGLEFR
jgi:phosphomannomutase